MLLASFSLVFMYETIDTLCMCLTIFTSYFLEHQAQAWHYWAEWLVAGSLTGAQFDSLLQQYFSMVHQ